MKNLVIIILAVIAGAASYAAFQNTSEKTVPSGSVPETSAPSVEGKEDYTAIKTADDMLGSLVENAGKNHPDEMTSVGMQKEALNAMDQLMDSAQGTDEKVLTAAAAFFGAYHVNVTARPELCSKQNVDISAFVRLFQEKNAGAYARTLSVIRANGYTKASLEAEVGPQLKQATAIDMNDIATGIKGDLAAACQFMNTQRAMMVRELSFQKRLPDAYKILMGGE